MKEHKHLIGSIVVMILTQMLLFPSNILGTVLSLVWLACVIYAQIGNGVTFKRSPEFKDYFLFHVQAVKFSVQKVLKIKK
jgi:hypothetical protein